MATRKPPSVALSREAILAAARELASGEGTDSLSMRRLAQRLDVWPMSIYTYFRDKEELLEALAASAAADVDVPGPGGPWRERMVQLLEAMRGALGQDPARAFLTPEVLRLSDAGVAILTDAGLDRQEAARCWRALWSYTAGFASLDLGPDPDAARRRVRMAVAAMEESPALGRGDELAEAFAGGAPFRFGLERLLDGIERDAA